MSFGSIENRLSLVECRSSPRKGKRGIVFDFTKWGNPIVWWFSGIPNDLIAVKWYDIRRILTRKEAGLE